MFLFFVGERTELSVETKLLYCSRKQITTTIIANRLNAQGLDFLSLRKVKTIPEDWGEIREKLVSMGTDIYNKINESDL